MPQTKNILASVGILSVFTLFLVGLSFHKIIVLLVFCLPLCVFLAIKLRTFSSGFYVTFLPNFFVYKAWLFWQLVKCGLHVSFMPFSLKNTEIIIDEKISDFPIQKSSNFKLSLICNSITLTPGSLVIYYKEGYIKVHALKASFFDDVTSVKLIKLINSLFR